MSGRAMSKPYHRATARRRPRARGPRRRDPVRSGEASAKGFPGQISEHLVLAEELKGIVIDLEGQKLRAVELGHTDTVIASHKRPENDDSPTIIEQTHKYIRDFDRLVKTTKNAQELYGCWSSIPTGSIPGGRCGARPTQPGRELKHDHASCAADDSRVAASPCRSIAMSRGMTSSGGSPRRGTRLPSTTRSRGSSRYRRWR